MNPVAPCAFWPKGPRNAQNGSPYAGGPHVWRCGSFKQAVTILLDNARKYNRPGGLIMVTLEGTPKGCALRVADTGIGIPVDARPFLFDRFFRVDVSRSRLGQDGYNEGSGAGLGLAIAKWSAEQHKGSLTLQESSEAGSIFMLELDTNAFAKEANQVDIQISSDGNADFQVIQRPGERSL